MEADGEWSDGSDEALKSGSATDIGPSDGEELNGRSNDEESKMAASNRLLKTDPVNAILDKIDAELGAIDGSSIGTSKGLTCQKPTGKNKNSVIPDTTTPLTPTKLPPQTLNNGIRDQSTGIYKKLEKVKDGDQCPSDLDSLAAEQIDEKFKEIMKKKRGGYLEDLNTQHSDNETIKTEDFETKFKSTLLNNKVNCKKKAKKIVSFSDQVMKTKPPSGKKKVGELNNQSKSPPRVQQTPTHLSPVRNVDYASDLESVQTEDFENKFKDMMFKDHGTAKRSLPPSYSQASHTRPTLTSSQSPVSSMFKDQGTAKGSSPPSYSRASQTRPTLTSSQSPVSSMFKDQGTAKGSSTPSYSQASQKRPTLSSSQSPVSSMFKDQGTAKGRSPPSYSQASQTRPTLSSSQSPVSSMFKDQGTRRQGSPLTLPSSYTQSPTPSARPAVSSSPSPVSSNPGRRYLPEVSEKQFTTKSPERKIHFAEPNSVVTELLLNPSVEPVPRRTMLSVYGRNTPPPQPIGTNRSMENTSTVNLSQSLSVPTLQSSIPCSQTASYRHQKKLSRHYSLDENSSKSISKLQTLSNFEDDDSTKSSANKSVSSLESLTSANALKQFDFDKKGFLISRQNSMNSVSSGYVAEHEDSLNDPTSRSPSASDFLLENLDKNSDGLDSIFDRVLTWDNDPSHGGDTSFNSSTNTAESETNMRSSVSESELSAVSGTRHLILPDEDASGICFSKHFLSKDTQSDSSVKFSAESSMFSESTESLFSKQHSTSLPSLPSASISPSPNIPNISPPMSKFASQENLNYGNFALYNPIMQQMQPTTAEGMLMNLGFGDVGKCIPQRFLNSWYEKLAKAQLEQQQILFEKQKQMSQMTEMQNKHPKIEHKQSSKDSSRVSFEDIPKVNCSPPTSKCKSKVKTTRLARLRQYIESHAGLLKVGMGVTKEQKRHLFSNQRQQSLPISLETLKEEEEMSGHKNHCENPKDYLKLSKEELSDSVLSYSDSDLSYSSREHTTKPSKESSGKKAVSTNSENPETTTAKNTDLTKVRNMESTQSSDSFEVASFMKPTLIEPAMVSIVLQDVDSNIQKIGIGANSSDQTDVTLLHIPLSRSSSSSMSPIPLSPVTVIEVGLDNQLDSLDIDDNTSIVAVQCNSGHHGNHDSLKPEGNQTFEETQDCDARPTYSVQELPSENENSSKFIQVDDGCLSPLEVFTDYDELIEIIKDLGDEFYLCEESGVQCLQSYDSQNSRNVPNSLVSSRLLGGWSDSDSMFSDSRSSSPVQSVSYLKSPPPDVHKPTNQPAVERKNSDQSKTKEEGHSLETKHLYLNSPSLVLTNENGEDNNIDPDSDSNYKSLFKPIETCSSMDSSIGSDDDHHLITKPRPRRSSRHKRIIAYETSEFSNSDDSMFDQPKLKLLYKCDSIEQECQTDKIFTSLSLSPSPPSHHDMEIQVETDDSLASLIDKCTQTDIPVEHSIQTSCQCTQTDQKPSISKGVQTFPVVRTAEAFTQTRVDIVSRNVDTQTDFVNYRPIDDSTINVKNGIRKEVEKRYTSTAVFLIGTGVQSVPLSNPRQVYPEIHQDGVYGDDFGFASPKRAYSQDQSITNDRPAAPKLHKISKQAFSNKTLDNSSLECDGDHDAVEQAYGNSSLDLLDGPDSFSARSSDTGNEIENHKSKFTTKAYFNIKSSRHPPDEIEKETHEHRSHIMTDFTHWTGSPDSSESSFQRPSDRHSELEDDRKNEAYYRRAQFSSRSLARSENHNGNLLTNQLAMTFPSSRPRRQISYPRKSVKDLANLFDKD